MLSVHHLGSHANKCSLQEQGAIPEPTKQHPAQLGASNASSGIWKKTRLCSGLMFTITTALMILDESVTTFKCALKLFQLPLNQVMKSHKYAEFRDAERGRFQAQDFFPSSDLPEHCRALSVRADIIHHPWWGSDGVTGTAIYRVLPIHPTNPQ